MRELLRDKNRLEHMLEHICKAEDAAKGFTFEQFNKVQNCILHSHFGVL